MNWLQKSWAKPNDRLARARSRGLSRIMFSKLSIPRSGSARMTKEPRASHAADKSGSDRPPLHERRWTVVLGANSPRVIPPKVDCGCFTSVDRTNGHAHPVERCPLLGPKPQTFCPQRE